MKLKDLHRQCVAIGMKYDPREPKRIEAQLKKYREDAKKKPAYMVDEERFWNPYHDSRILYGTGNEEVKRVFIGIDVEVPQLLLVDRLRERGEKIDAVLLHHPQGRASVELAEDMRVQIDVYRQYGVPVVQIEQQLEQSIESARRDEHTSNIFEWQRSAELLGIPGFNCHTPADNLVYQFFEKGICRQNFMNVGELMNAILEIPEFRSYAEQGLPPMLLNCSENSRTGRIAPTGINGGTEGPPSFIKEQADAGIGTVIAMHASEEQVRIAKEHFINIIQVNHYAGDNLGMNLMLDLLGRHAKLDVLPGCGFHRFERSDKELKVLTGKPKAVPTEDEANS